jgi:hypothetical protein
MSNLYLPSARDRDSESDSVENLSAELARYVISQQIDYEENRRNGTNIHIGQPIQLPQPYVTVNPDMLHDQKWSTKYIYKDYKQIKQSHQFRFIQFVQFIHFIQSLTFFMFVGRIEIYNYYVCVSIWVEKENVKY